MDQFSIDQIIQPFMNILQQESYDIQSAAMRVFYYFALIELAFTAIWMTLAGEGLHSMLNKLVNMAFLLGVFYACIQHGGEWIQLIINGFIDVGSRSGKIDLNPVAIFNSGFKIVIAVFKGTHQWGILKAFVIGLMSAFLCVVFILIYALIAAELAILLVKSYFLVALSSLFFAFAGTEMTREMTVRYFQTVIGLGLQLMTLYFIVGIGQAMNERWLLIVHAAMEHKQIMPVLGIFGGVIVYFLMVKTIPVFIASLAGGGRMQNYSGQAIATAVAAGYAVGKFNDARRNISPSAGVAKIASMLPDKSPSPVSPKPPGENKLDTSKLVRTTPYHGHIIKK